MKNFISEANLNAYMANQKANKVITAQDLPSNNGISLSRVVLRIKAFKHPSGVPFYAFVKQAGEQTVLVDVETGATKVVSNHQFAAQTNVRGKFKIGCFTYEQKDTIHGMPRYKVVDCNKYKRTNKID